MKLLFTSISFIAIIFLSGCHKNDNPVNATDISGEYRYYGYDMQNNLVTTGTLNIVVNGKQITGTKDLSGDKEDGKGEITGSIDENNNITVYLNPNQMGLLYLKGNSSGSAIIGKRIFDTGTKAFIDIRGRFLASKGPL